MAKLQRKSAKLFAENANAGIGGVAQFGSLADGNPNYSKDVDVIQALDAYKNGWSDAVVGNKSPAIEDRNALDYLLSYQQAYIMQHGVPEWIGTETYYKDCFVVDSNGELRVSTMDSNIGHDPIEDEGGQYWGFAGARGSGKRIGEVYFSQSSSATDNPGALPLFTGEVIANADQLYPQFYAWVLSHTNLCKTEEQYQTAISTYGECPYYVINTSAKTIRLPKLVNYIKMANTTDKITQSAAGLPNITGSPIPGESSSSWGTMPPVSGAIYRASTGADRYAGAKDADNDYLAFDASLSNPIYGGSNTVTPAHTTIFPWVCVYNTAIPASTAQAAEFQEALSNKADVDLSNCTKPYIMETWHSGTEWCRIWSDGWCEQGGFVQGTNNYRKDVTFHQEFADTNYTVLFGLQYTTSFQDNVMVETSTKSTTGFTMISSNNSGVGSYWEAKGYIS